MSFNENLWSTFIGAILAFILGVAAFYFTEKIRNHSSKARLTKALKNEIEYNYLLISQQADLLTKVIEQMASSQRPINIYFGLRNFQRSILDQYYYQGHAYDIFKPDDILALSKICDYVSSPVPDYVNNLIKGWNGEENSIEFFTEKLIIEKDYLLTILRSYQIIHSKILKK